MTFSAPVSGVALVGAAGLRARCAVGADAIAVTSNNASKPQTATAPLTKDKHGDRESRRHRVFSVLLPCLRVSVFNRLSLMRSSVRRRVSISPSYYSL